MPRIPKLRLNKGDTVILSEGGREQRGEVERGQPNRIVATGKFGTLRLELKSEDDETVLRIEVEERDAEGRRLLYDGE